MKKFTFLFVFAIVANSFICNVAFGQITQVTGSPQSSTTTSTTLTITRPSGLAVGDLMIANIVQSDNDGADGGDLSNASLSGWTLIAGNQTGITGSSGDEWWGTLLYRVATASDVSAASFAFGLDAEADDGSGAVIAFSGVDLTGGVTETGAAGGPFDIDPGNLYQNVVSDQTLNADAITTATANAAVIMCGVLANNVNLSTWSTTTPGTLTEIYDLPFDASLDMGSGAAWAIKSATGSTGGGTASISGGNNVFNGSLLIALKQAPIPIPNLWSANGTSDVLKYTVDPVTGNVLSGATSVFTPLTSTAALGKNKITGTDPDGCLYYLNRDDNNTLNGVVTIYAVKPDGTGNGTIGSIDMNGSGDNTDFSFVRLGFDDLGRGWILAGGQTSPIFIASFVGKGTGVSGQLTPGDINTFGNTPLTIAAPGSQTEFQNGDLAVSGTGTLYALANVTGGQTYVYTLNSLTTPTTLTRRWTVQTSGGTFSGSVNGLAWTQSGSLHFSTGTGIYFINQATANTVSGTVQATLVPGSSSSTLTDLASDKFPQQSTLPLNLTEFAVSKSGNNALLNWKTSFELNTDHFEIERSYDGINFNAVGSKQAAGNSAIDVYYQFIDPITISSGNIYYRLKTLDLDGKSTYSKIVVLRLSGNTVKDFTVFPNPFTSNLKVEINSEKEISVSVRISNATGQVIINRNVILQKGVNVVVLSSELQNLKPGMHILEIISEEGKMTQKIIKR